MSEIYAKRDDGNPSGFACFSRYNFDKITATLKDEKNCPALIVCTFGLLSAMTSNNYIEKLNYPKLVNMINKTIKQSTLEHAKTIQKLIELDIIAVNDKKQCMINPCMGFACSKKDDYLETLQRSYEEFKETGKYYMAFVKKGNNYVIADRWK